MKSIPENFWEEGFFLQNSPKTVWIQGTLEFPIDLFLQEAQRRHAPLPLEWSGPDKAAFLKTLSELRPEFETGRLLKAVPVVFEEALLQKSAKPQYCLGALSEVPAGCRLYGYWNSQGEGMIGATPELLLEQKSPKHFQSMALAGTAQNAETLKSDPKEQREHAIVVKDIFEALSPLGRVTLGPTEVMTLPGLNHLRTLIDLETTGKTTAEEIVRALHPTAALGAYPRDAGRWWLQGQEKTAPRWKFGTPFGGTGPSDQSLFVVAIRNIQWRQGKVRLGAGCGVMRGFDAEREWRELELKRNTVKKMLGC